MLWILIGTPFFFLINTIRLITENDSITMRQNLYQTGTWLIEGMSTMLRGLTQVGATPLVYLFETPLRMLITKIKGERKIEENNGIQRKINDGLNIIINENRKFGYDDGKALSEVLLNIHYQKFERCKDYNDQKTDINADLESNLFDKANDAGSEMTTNSYKEKVRLSLRYFSLFKSITLSPNELEIIRKRIDDPEFTSKDYELS